MRSPTAKTVKVLFARSGNRCAFPGCLSSLVTPDDCVIGEICHIKALSKGGPRYSQEQPDKERQAAQNLILMCSVHHKTIDDDPQTYTADLLAALKKEREANINNAVTPTQTRQAQLLLKQYIFKLEGNVTIGTIHAESVILKTPRASRVRVVVSPEVIGGNPDHRAYVRYLIDQYNRFAKAQKDRVFQHFRIYVAIKRELKADWEQIPLTRFDQASAFLQKRIDNTMLGRQRRSAGQSNYERFDQFCNDHR